MKPRLEGQVAVVTGAASGIGFGTVRALAAEGARCVAADINADALDAVSPRLQADGGQVETAVLDVTSSAQVEAFFARLDAELGRVDVLVNNAGIGGRATVAETSEELWDRVISVNLKSVFLMSRAVIPIMLRQGAGRIINMGSGAGVVGVRQQASYCASKGGVVLLTKQMAKDYERLGIRVNAVCPTTVLTPMVQRRLDTFPDPEQALRDLEADLGPLLSPEEVAGVICFLATDGLKNAPVPYIQ